MEFTIFNIVDMKEYGVDSRYKNNEEKELDSKNLMSARLIRISKLTKYQILRAKLLQLKLKLKKINMKKIISYIGAYTTFYLGDLTRYIMIKLDPIFSTVLYNIYNKLMSWSSDIQDWGGLDKPWNNHV